MYKMKYSCYQDLFIEFIGLFIEFNFWLRNARKSDFGCYRFRFSPCLMRKRVEKSQAIPALLEGFQELHLDW